MFPSPPPVNNFNPFLTLVESTDNPPNAAGNGKPGSDPASNNPNVEKGQGQVQQQLLEYIQALKFDADKNGLTAKAATSGDNSVDSLLGDKFQLVPGRRGVLVKSKANFSNKSSAAYLDQNITSSSAMAQRQAQQQKVKDSTTPDVIRDWGKRPMLVESEAPWTPRNRMYFRAVKALGTKQQVKNTVGLTFPQFMALKQQQQQQQQQQQRATTATLIPPSSSSRPGTYLPIPTANGLYLPQNFTPPKMPLLGTTVPQTSYVTGISGPLHHEMISSRPIAVAIEPQYPYQQEFVFPVQPHPPYQTMQMQPQTMLFSNMDSQGLWMPMIEQHHPQYHHHPFQQYQDQLERQQLQQRYPP